jgi:hypothetical protein
MKTPQPLIGLARFPIVRQQDAFSCGAACLRMVCNHLEFHPRVSVKEIARIAGTNPKTGTTDVEMRRGLAALGLSFEYPKGPEFTSTEYLRAVLLDNVVFLRTLLPGGPRHPEGFKHWVILHGWDTKGFLVACPGAGARRWGDAFTYKVWAARDFDHFVVSSDRRDHPAALRQERARIERAWRPVHEMTLLEFLRNVPVVPNHKLVRWHHDAIRDAADAIQLMGTAGAGRLMAYDGAPGFAFRAVPRNGATQDMVVIDTANGKLAGGISRGLRWVHPDYRGRGLGAEIALAAHSEPGAEFLCPISYSEGGYASRVAAWRLAVTRALEAGVDVKPEVLSDFDSIVSKKHSTEDRPQERLNDSDETQLSLF